MKKLLIKNLEKTFKKRKVVNNISFEIAQGEVVGLLGPNGAGKTTSFYMTVGLVKPDKGKVIFHGTDLTGLPMYKRAKIGIGYLPQEESVFRKLSVENNIKAILEVMNLEKNTINQRCDELLEQFKIDHVRKQMGYTLSGGERRRVEIARSMAADPKILLLDEPFAGVDPIAIKDIQNVIKEIQKMDIGILITDHNVRETLKIVNRAYIMSQGQILISGTARQLIRNKEAKKIYLGDDFKL